MTTDTQSTTAVVVPLRATQLPALVDQIDEAEVAEMAENNRRIVELNRRYDAVQQAVRAARDYQAAVRRTRKTLHEFLLAAYGVLQVAKTDPDWLERQANEYRVVEPRTCDHKTALWILWITFLGKGSPGPARRPNREVGQQLSAWAQVLAAMDRSPRWASDPGHLLSLVGVDGLRAYAETGFHMSEGEYVDSILPPDEEEDVGDDSSRTEPDRVEHDQTAPAPEAEPVAADPSDAELGEGRRRRVEEPADIDPWIRVKPEMKPVEELRSSAPRQRSLIAQWEGSIVVLDPTNSDHVAIVEGWLASAGQTRAKQ